MKRKTNREHAVARIALMVAIGIVLGCMIYYLNATLVGGNLMPMPFGCGVGVVASGSMEPKLSIDDLIVVKRCDSYSVGDVVVYQSGRMLVVHEIVAIDEAAGTVQTWGCANDTYDDPIPIHVIKGRVVKSYENFGAVLLFLKSPAGIVTVLAFLVALLLLSQANEKKRDEKAHGEQIQTLREEIDRLRQETERSENND